jgi:hypothetical protein
MQPFVLLLDKDFTTHQSLACATYRHAFSPEGLEHSRARAARKLTIPMLAFGAEAGVGTALIDTMRLVASGVREGVFKACGHYMPEVAPCEIAQQITAI